MTTSLCAPHSIYRVVVEHVAAKYPSSAMTAIGYSLGGNILVRYLGEQGANTPIQAAVSLCNPFTLVGGGL